MDENRLGEALWAMHLENMHALDTIVEKQVTVSVAQVATDGTVLSRAGNIRCLIN